MSSTGNESARGRATQRRLEAAYWRQVAAMKTWHRTYCSRCGTTRAAR